MKCKCIYHNIHHIETWKNHVGMLVRSNRTWARIEVWTKFHLKEIEVTLWKSKMINNKIILDCGVWINFVTLCLGCWWSSSFPSSWGIKLIGQLKRQHILIFFYMMNDEFAPIIYLILLCFLRFFLEGTTTIERFFWRSLSL